MKTIPFFTLLVFGFWACNQPAKAEDYVKNVSDFESVNLKVPAYVLWEDSDEPACLVQCSPDNEKKIEVVQEGKTLIIKSKTDNWSGWGDEGGRITIRLKSSSLAKVNINGSGDFVMKNNNDSPNFEFAINGSGDLKAMVSADKCKGGINGSGDVQIGGKAKNFDCTISGSGDVKALGFHAETVDVQIAGSGDAEVWATESLNVKIAGSGDVKYKGEPKKINQKVAGSGEIKKV